MDNPPEPPPDLTVLFGDPADVAALLQANHPDPHRFLGPHAETFADETGVVVRVFHPEAKSINLVLADGLTLRLKPIGSEGLFALWLPGETAALAYRLEFSFAEGPSWIRHDPYRFPPTLGDFDLYLLGEGTHQQLWQALGARPLEVLGVAGFAFAVWAPNARRVSVVGDFCHWDGRLLPMRRLGLSGIFELFVPGLASGELYKYEILTADGAVLLKADPVGTFGEVPPGTASRTFCSTYTWNDAAWLAARRARDIHREPLSIYEVHLGSWRRDPDDPSQFLNYRQLAPQLVLHLKQLGMNTLELLPISEHPFSGSWGYQVSGYYKPTARFGDPDDFRFFVDYCHQNGIGVILDWVPGHFVKDAHGLGRFDGTALYEHLDPRLGLHPDWDTYIFNLARFEVKNFLIANALYWFAEFHIDGLRVDAVASMLYLDYSRKEGEWIPNPQGGRENLDALAFLRAVNTAVKAQAPGCFMIAEESTTWPLVSHPVAVGGLGFDFKWNMGWMHDTLNYFGTDPLFRSGSHDRLTFAMVYEYSEHYVNPLSHDEVVHGKRALLEKMPGDRWRQFASLRTLLTYQFTRPGKKLLFMGSEIAPSREWDHELALPWYLLEDPERAPFFRFLCALGHLYLERRPLWWGDPDPESFQWIACHDRERSVVSYERRCPSSAGAPPAFATPASESEPQDLKERLEHLVIVLNLTPVPRPGYRVGAPRPGSYRLLFSSDDSRYGGSSYPILTEVATEDLHADGFHQSMVLTLPPLSALVWEPLPPADAPGRKRKASRKVLS